MNNDLGGKLVRRPTDSTRRWSALALIVTAQFMVILDVAIVNVALPSIKSDLGFSQGSLQWVISAYAIFFGGTLLLGGVLTSYISWPWIFFVNVPVGVAAAVLTPIVLRESKPDVGHRHFDIRGAVTATSGLILLVYALTRATSDGWTSAATLATLSGALALLAAFIALETRSPWPLLPLRVFRQRTLAAANVSMAIIGAVAFSEFFVLTLYLQDVLHYSAVQSGAAFSGFALAVVVVSNVAQVVVGRLGVRSTLTAGLLVSAVSVAGLTRLPMNGHYFWDLFPWFVLGGAGMGLSFVPATIASLPGRAHCD